MVKKLPLFFSMRLMGAHWINVEYCGKKKRHELFGKQFFWLCGYNDF